MQSLPCLTVLCAACRSPNVAKLAWRSSQWDACLVGHAKTAHHATAVCKGFCVVPCPAVCKCSCLTACAELHHGLRAGCCQLRLLCHQSAASLNMPAHPPRPAACRCAAWQPAAAAGRPGQVVGDGGSHGRCCGLVAAGGAAGGAGAAGAGGGAAGADAAHAGGWVWCWGADDNPLQPTAGRPVRAVERLFDETAADASAVWMGPWQPAPPRLTFPPAHPTPYHHLHTRPALRSCRT